VSPVDRRQAAYGLWIAVLSVLSLACVLGIVWAEVASTQHPVTRLTGGVLIGVVLLAYSFILLFLRKGGFTGV
jgi:hypothetical protein